MANAGNIAVGDNARAGSTAIGQTDATALGTSAQANVANGTALGARATATGLNSVALGQNSAATTANTVSVGNAATGLTRQITNVTAGTVSATSTDAVNGSQLNATNQSVATNAANIGSLGSSTATALGGGASYNATTGAFTGLSYGLNGSGTTFTDVVSGIQAVASGAAGPVQYATPGVASNAVNLVGSGGAVRVGNIAAGAAATDAVNVAQLTAVSLQAATGTNNLGTTAAAAIGGGATYSSATNSILGPSYTLNGSTATHTDVISGLKALASGAAGPLQYATPGTVSNAVNLVGTGGAVTLGNVAAGAITAVSTEAVNGSQLYATNQTVAGLAAGTSGLVQQDPITRTITIGGSANGSLVSVAGKAGNRQVTSVAAGALSAASTDAVNGSQLFSTNQQVSANAGNIAALQFGQAGPFRDNNVSGYAAPQASGADAVSGGFGSVASGQQSTTLGTGAQATRAGAVAVGAFAQATADPTTAVGFSAAATGNDASAFGAFTSASGAGSTALGRSATAAGASSVAIGIGAAAAKANSVAVGAGVATTRANQVAIGTAGQTYTLAGLSSAQSLAAQSGATSLVTADADGNLATSSFNLNNVSALDGRVSALESGLDSLGRFARDSRREARRGIAAVAAAAPMLMPSLPGKTSLTVKASTYRGEVGGGFTVAHRLDTALPAVIFGSYSNGGGSENVFSGGAGIEF